MNVLLIPFDSILFLFFYFFAFDVHLLRLCEYSSMDLIEFVITLLFPFLHRMHLALHHIHIVTHIAHSIANRWPMSNYKTNTFDSRCTLHNCILQIVHCTPTNIHVLRTINQYKIIRSDWMLEISCSFHILWYLIQSPIHFTHLIRNGFRIQCVFWDFL